MTSIRLYDHVRSEIIAHARDEAPNECCGLLIGDRQVIDESVRARNVDAHPARRYELDAAEHIAAIRRLRGTSRAVIGSYHSHPKSPPVPSESDLAEAFYPEFIWIIVSLQTPEAQVAAYRMVADGFRPISIAGSPKE
jgi:desampylase